MSNTQSKMSQMGVAKNPVLFFDGICGLCSGFVSFLFLIDRGKVFKVATLQGPFASKTLSGEVIQHRNSLVVLSESGEILTKSRAVLFILKRIGGVWSLLAFLGASIPTAIADRAYEIISRNRYKAFGKLEACRTPSAEERSRFLD